MPAIGLAACLQPRLNRLAFGSTAVQFLSDLHLEYCSQYTTFHLPVQAPYLVLAGNIGQLKDYSLYLEFLANVCQQYKRVFLVLGSQELYGLTREEAKVVVDNLQQEVALNGKLSILDRNRVDITRKLSVLGCTLFSMVSAFDSTSSLQVEDSKRVSLWPVADRISAHQTDVEWLQNEITLLREQRGLKHKILVVTNYAPLKIYPSGKEEKQPMSPAVDETQLLGRGTELDTVQGWIFGRTGSSIDLMSGQVRVLSNPRGVVTPFEDEDTTWTREIDPISPKARAKAKRAFDFNVRRTVRF